MVSYQNMWMAFYRSQGIYVSWRQKYQTQIPLKFEICGLLGPFQPWEFCEQGNTAVALRLSSFF